MSRSLSELRNVLVGLPRCALLAHPQLPASVWPGARVLAADCFAAGPRPELRFDLIIARAPGGDAECTAWLRNAGASARALLVLLPAAQRGAVKLSASDVLGWAELARDDLGPSESAAEPWHALLLRGQLRSPLLRIDDYPTGVRPLPEDLAPIHRVLEAFEARALPYHLGIVPGILTDAMFEFLRGLQHMIPAQHGFDHAYPRMAAKLRRRRDPRNERGTVGTFNEFRFHTYGAMQRKLRRGKDLLEQRLARAVTTYIPPCNVCDRATTRALAGLGFRLCLSERPVRGSLLPVLGSDFYGCSTDPAPEASAEVICLHTNWEWDVARNQPAALDAFLDRVLATAAAKQQALERAAELLEVWQRA